MVGLDTSLPRDDIVGSAMATEGKTTINLLAHLQPSSQPLLDAWSFVFLAIGFLSTFLLHLQWWIAILVYEFLVVWQQVRECKRRSIVPGQAGCCTRVAVDTLFFSVGTALGEYARNTQERNNLKSKICNASWAHRFPQN